MTDSVSTPSEPTAVGTPVPAPAPPTGLKAKATELGTKAYLAAPPKAQTAILNGVAKAQPLVAKVKPHQKRVLAGLAGLLVLRKVRGRRG